MERDYIPRRASSPAPRRRQTVRGRNNRRKSGPPLLPLLLFLVVVAVVVVLIVVFVGGKQEKEPDADSSNLPSSSSLSSGPVSSTGGLPSEVNSSPESSMPVQSAPSAAPEELGGVLKVGDSGYEHYNFNEDAANSYITLLADVGKQLEGSATVYDMVIPTSMDIMLPESYIEKHNINSQDQRKAIEDYIYPSITAMNPQVKTVSIFDALKRHCNEYVYFRTDHHWTQLGAYYAYVELCKTKGVDAVPLNQFEKKEYPGFLGSFYSESPNNDMESNPDTVEAYIPNANASLYAVQQEGDDLEDWPVIQDGTDYSSENKYLIFIAGDQPYEEITNSDLTDGSSCVVVKESFGNALVPFLVNHYQTIYVVDYRYYQGNIVDLVKEKGSSDVIFLNNISMTRNEDLVEELSNRF